MNREIQKHDSLKIANANAQGSHSSRWLRTATTPPPLPEDAYRSSTSLIVTHVPKEATLRRGQSLTPDDSHTMDIGDTGKTFAIIVNLRIEVLHTACA